MDRATVPEQDDVPAEMTQEQAQEDRYLAMGDVVGVEVRIEPAPVTFRADRHGRNGGDSVVSVAMTNYRGVPARRPGAADGRDEQKAGFAAPLPTPNQSPESVGADASTRLSRSEQKANKSGRELRSAAENSGSIAALRLRTSVRSALGSSGIGAGGLDINEFTVAELEEDPFRASGGSVGQQPL